MDSIRVRARYIVLTVDDIVLALSLKESVGGGEQAGHPEREGGLK